jgi:type I restriction enzyme S subunit
MSGEIRRFKRYPIYKDSGVEWLGEIPRGWPVMPLKRVAQFAGGGTPSKDNVEFWKGDIPWVSPKDMKVGTVIETEDNITSEAVQKSATRLVPRGAVLIVVRSGILIHTIPVALAGRELTLNQDLKAIVSSPALLPAYLRYFIIGMQQQLLMEWKREGATVESLEMDLIANTKTPLPDHQEQHAIAAFLDRETARIDTLVAKKERLIELLREQRSALITRAVTKGLDPNVPMTDSGVEWLGEIPAHWDVKPLKRIFANLDSRRKPLSGEERATMAKEYPYYGASGIIDRVEDYLFDEPLILVAEDGANLYSRSTPLAFVAVGRFWVNNHAHILKPQDNMVLYWSNVLASIVFDPWVSGSAQPKLTSESLGSIPLPVPPLSEREQIQKAIGGEMERFDALLESVTGAMARLLELRTALISAAVTGKIDVREEIA